IHFSFQHYRPHRYLHSFPTRRSSDLAASLSGQIVTVRLASGAKFARSSVVAPPAVVTNTSSLASASTQFSPSTYQHGAPVRASRSEEHTSELQSRGHLVCRLLLEKKK